MMVASTAAVLDLGIQTLHARSLTLRIRRGLDGSRMYLRALLYGARLASILQRVVRGLRKAARDGQFDSMSDQEFDVLTDDLFKLYIAVRASTRAAQKVGLPNLTLHGHYFREIEKATDSLEDVIESLRLASNEDFKRLTLQAIDSLP
jgi:hypothetical protein